MRGSFRPAGQPQILTIYGSNIVLTGDGDDSRFSVQTWTNQDTSGYPQTDPITGVQFTNYLQAYIQISNPRGPIQNVVLERFSFVGPPRCNADSIWDANKLSAMQLGGQGVVGQSGFTSISARNTCAMPFALNGGSNNPGTEIICGSATRDGNGNPIAPNTNCDDFVTNCRIMDVGAGAINPWSGGHENTLVSGNIIDGTAVGAIEWASSRVTISNNIFSNIHGAAVIFTQGSTETGWSVVSNNTFINVGNQGSQVSPTIALGESSGAYRVRISGNTIHRAYGPGIVSTTGGSTADIIVEGNTIDGFGVGAVASGATSPLGWVGISIVNAERSPHFGRLSS